MNELKEATVVAPDPMVPPGGKRVIVISKDFGCLGYRDPDGVWRTDDGDEKINEVFAWLEFLN
jgi:hypothetical protein